MTRHTPWAVCAAVTAVVVVLGGCTDDEPEVPEVPSSTTPTATPESPVETTTGTPGAAPTAGVPELCSDLIATVRVAQIVETPMPSGVRRIYNDDHLESSGRIGRLTCEYGVGREDDQVSPSPSPGNGDEEDAGAVLEVAVSAYTGADVATGRIGRTVDQVGGQVEALTVGGNDGFLLRDDEDVSLIFADGVRTYVITIVRGFVPGPAESVVLVGIASEILGESEEDEA